MKKLFLIILPLFFLPGCAMFSTEIDRVAGKIGSGVDRYCLELQQADRVQVRQRVNPTPGGATIVVTCPGDT